MDPLIQMVRHYCQSQDLAFRDRLAEDIAQEILPVVVSAMVGSGPHQDVEDVVQEALIAIFEGIDTFRGDSSGRFVSWCRVIARRKRADILKESKRHQGVPLDEHVLWEILEADGESISPRERLEIKETIELLKHSDPEDYELLREFYMDEMNYAELAAKYSINYDAVRMRIERARKKARKNFKTWSNKCPT